jgi:hypothetical protein
MYLMLCVVMKRECEVQQVREVEVEDKLQPFL